YGVREVSAQGDKDFVTVTYHLKTHIGTKVLEFVEKTSLYPNVTMRGTKLILMEVGNVKFLDSLNYFPMPLTALPKAFDLKELKKGYFPHLFNTLAHQNYVGPIPALDFYDPDHLKEDAREKLLKWHGERQAEGYVFDFQKEIVEYCISDVEILTQACLKFRDLMKTETTVDPFQESTTIASCCNKVFRRNFLKPETIGILPNQNLYHPVLPSKMNNKLMFVNCQKCGEDFVREECQHSIQERSLKGTWVIEEVLKAIEKGYQIIETYEIWEYDTIQLSKDQEGLFSGMMNKFLQIKQQASGWPKHCLTDEEKNRYIDAFLDREDIKLEFSKIIENPCLRSLAKLMLNSFWGKFAQKENQNKTSIVRDCGEFFDMLTNPSIHVNTVLPVNEETLLITWEFREEAYDVSSTVNVVLASYVTALARLKLYSFLEKVEERAVYVDTDSCIYISRKGLDDISTGDFIGDMTDELNGGFISEFVSGGPKNYAYKYTTLSGEEQIVCKKTSLYPNVTMRGTKLILMEVGNVKFLDSLNYFPMPLTALPKAFDLKELKKGYFPHLFNTLAHQNYVGPIPALDFYDPDHLKEDAREKLLKWHGERQAEGYVFDFQKEIVEYCISDVEILTQACLKFRDLMKTETTVDPFQESTTIASCCNKVFRRNFLKPETIGILPNQNLYHPVLPSKMNNKLMFVNCQKCGEDFVREECQHSIQERSLKGTWVIEEVLKAIEKGYQIIETYEIWEYDTIQLSKDQEGLFSGMMNKFLQIKQQASGWPKHCLTDEEKNRYIDAFLDREDIKLEFSKIIENPCLRSLAKLMLNSFWGKFAQKENQNKTSIVRDCGEFFDMLTNPSIHVNTVLPVNEETLLITWEFREEAYDVSSTVNVVLASYVTALARLKLYSFLEKVEERAVYVDTDSCIYISRKGLDDISTGDFIGDMTDELNGGFISEFVSGGPKNYAYKYTTLSGEEQIVCKNYVGPIPALDFYDPDHLKEDAREKLLKWHGERQAEDTFLIFRKKSLNTVSPMWKY
ncbi:unnamed protein product, partial [Acanthoscelides obtectus]